MLVQANNTQQSQLQLDEGAPILSLDSLWRLHGQANFHTSIKSEGSGKQNWGDSCSSTHLQFNLTLPFGSKDQEQVNIIRAFSFGVPSFIWRVHLVWQVCRH